MAQPGVPTSPGPMVLNVGLGVPDKIWGEQAFGARCLSLPSLDLSI